MTRDPRSPAGGAPSGPVPAADAPAETGPPSAAPPLPDWTPWWTGAAANA